MTNVIQILLLSNVVRRLERTEVVVAVIDKALMSGASQVRSRSRLTTGETATNSPEEGISKH